MQYLQFVFPRLLHVTFRRLQPEFVCPGFSCPVCSRQNKIFPVRGKRERAGKISRVCVPPPYNLGHGEPEGRGLILQQMEGPPIPNSHLTRCQFKQLDASLTATSQRHVSTLMSALVVSQARVCTDRCSCCVFLGQKNPVGMRRHQFRRNWKVRVVCVLHTRSDRFSVGVSIPIKTFEHSPMYRKDTPPSHCNQRRSNLVTRDAV